MDSGHLLPQYSCLRQYAVCWTIFIQPTISIQYLYNIYTMFIQCLYNIYTIFIQYLYNIYTIFIQPTIFIVSAHIQSGQYLYNQQYPQYPFPIQICQFCSEIFSQSNGSPHNGLLSLTWNQKFPTPCDGQQPPRHYSLEMSKCVKNARGRLQAGW